MNREGQSHLVGWPPIKSWRKKELHDKQHPDYIRINRINQANEVQFEALPLLSHSQSLLIISMFIKCEYCQNLFHSTMTLYFVFSSDLSHVYLVVLIMILIFV